MSPCLCTGSIQFIHLHCMRSWIFGKYASKNSFSLKIDRSACEICKVDIMGIGCLI